MKKQSEFLWHECQNQDKIPVFSINGLRHRFAGAIHRGLDRIKNIK